MKISVVMPVYNAEKHLQDSLMSVLNQSYPDWECICVDDGSCDASGAILDKFAGEDPRFRVVHKANGGEGSARNAATPLLSGDFVTYLDSDDCLHPNALRTIVAIHKRAGFDLLRFGMRNVSSHDGACPVLPDPVPYEEVNYRDCGESPFVFCGLGCATAVAVSIARRVRWSDIKVGADLFFVMDCLLLARRTIRTQVELMEYLINPASVSHRIWLGLLTGTCEYLPTMLEKSCELGLAPKMMQLAIAHVRELYFRRLLMSWNLLPNTCERELARQAFWGGVRRLLARGDVFSQYEAFWIRQASLNECARLLTVTVVWPYRLRRNLWKFVK